MLAKRIIPCLDVTAGRVVKGVSFVELRDAGDPVEIARRYDEQGADELTFLDITASSDDRSIIFHIIEKVAEQVFIPLTVGGGVREVQDVRNLLNAGADKVSINTSAVTNPQLVADAAARYGSQCIVVAIDAKQVAPGKWEVFTHGGRKATGLDTVEWARKMQSLGAGEILLTSMDQDGQKKGFDLALTRAVTDALEIPVIASGGVGNLQHLADGVKMGGADAVLAASIFHFGEYTVQQAKEVHGASRGSRCGYGASECDMSELAEQGELVGGRAGAGHCARCGDRARVDGGMDEPRSIEADEPEKRGDLLVAFAQEAVAQGRGIRSYPEGERDTTRLRCRCDPAASGTTRRHCLSYRTRKLFLQQTGERCLAGDRCGAEESRRDIQEMSNDILQRLTETLEARKSAAPESSYAAKLFSKGDDAILKKVIEEAGEVLLAAKDGDKQHLVYEVADLWFHSMVLLAQKGLSADDVLQELARREGVSGIAEKASRK